MTSLKQMTKLNRKEDNMYTLNYKLQIFRKHKATKELATELYRKGLITYKEYKQQERINQFKKLKLNNIFLTINLIQIITYTIIQLEHTNNLDIFPIILFTIINIVLTIYLTSLQSKLKK